MKELLRELPAIHIIQKDSRFDILAKDACITSSKLTEWVQEEINFIRQKVLNDCWFERINTKESYIDYIFKRLKEKSKSIHQYNLKSVINATGTILHTNLGRARLSKEAIRQVTVTAENYSNLEYDLKKGVRGSRHAIIESILTEITGAEAAMVVNNNAAAVYLILRALAKDKKVIVSRGELVEIGGAFRISSIMEESGAILKEVGTTNKTHRFDYEQAIDEDTVMLMKVHTSNFKTVGFTHSVTSEELVELVQQHRELLVYEDLGSGALYDFKIGDEPVVAKVLKKGVDLVSFSGDKLLGGPQAGIIAGKKELIKTLKTHQLARVLRVDKMTLAALEATLKSYIQGRVEEIPTIRDILLPLNEIKKRIELFLQNTAQIKNKWDFVIKEDTSQIGGGTMPGVEIPTFVVAVSHDAINSQHIHDHLRLGSPSIVTRLKNDQVLMDFRTINNDEIPIIIDALQRIG
ncbi:L-seryl-tRNA(Sec) selenium transferase [Bacillus sp. PK3_68]|uniref:L-seryl-tRNA(Sec) selenium transferase n=1 Tax=Bacillus sp. PK3_68 TaxID=2027408 RepID=UPI000E72E1FB|nr:L-seryl-tRNA(Sec) selenium transferase [Bacillus sp. PK3_68]RJS50054.1 L-seryl-tRNA(Sec) selenium transferase [Bacillus sp. PK3_68]